MWEWSWGSKRVSALAYTDDLVLVSRTFVGLAKLIRTVTDTMEKGGLEANARRPSAWTGQESITMLTLAKFTRSLEYLWVAPLNPQQ